MLAGSGGLYGRQGGAQLAALSPNVVVAAAPAASLGLSQPVSGAEEAVMPLSSEAQSSTVVAVASPNGQTVMLRDPRLDEPAGFAPSAKQRTESADAGQLPAQCKLCHGYPPLMLLGIAVLCLDSWFFSLESCADYASCY